MGTVKEIGLAILCALILRFLIFDFYRVEGNSMEPQIPANSIVLVNRLAYGLRIPTQDAYILQWLSPRPADVLLILDPKQGKPLIKRFIEMTPYGAFVVGDNAVHSIDSRLFGSIPLDNVLGKVILTIPGRGK